MAYIFVSEDAEEWKNRSLTETSVELENVSDFLKCTLPSSPTRTLLSITTPDKFLSSDSSSLVGESLPAYLDVLPRSHDNSDSYQAPPVPPRKSISASPRRKTSYVTCRHTHTQTHMRNQEHGCCDKLIFQWLQIKTSCSWLPTFVAKVTTFKLLCLNGAFPSKSQRCIHCRLIACGMTELWQWSCF